LTPGVVSHIPELDTIFVLEPVAACSNTLYLIPLSSSKYLLSKPVAGEELLYPTKVSAARIFKKVVFILASDVETANGKNSGYHDGRKNTNMGG
jgi:hypothetical protein